MSAVTQDSSSLRYCPASAAEWTTLLSGTGLASPSSFWKCDETSGSLADSGSGSRTVTVNGTPTYQATATGWTRKGIKPADNSATDYGTATIPDVNTTSCLLVQYFSLNTAATAARGLNRLGTATAKHATLQSGNKLRGTSGANTTDGSVTQAGTLVVVTKNDRTNIVFSVYTQGEKLAPSWTGSGSSTTMYLFGDGAAASDATLVYAALWTGTDAEMSDYQVQQLLDALEGNMTTKTKFSAGSVAYKTVVAIEGFDYLISDAPSAAVLDAWHGYDWTQVLGGLYVNVQNEQRVSRDSAFTTSGRCTIRVLDETGNDTLGKSVFRRLSGAETAITSTVDRNDTTIAVKSTLNFTSSGTAYIGNEAFAYTGTTATSFTGVTRGKWSPFGCAPSGSGGLRFGGHHRKGGDSNHVQMEPIVSQLPRVWRGKRVGVWIHTWDEDNSKLNHRREAQLVYAGRIVQLGDDPNNFTTVIELEHLTKDLQNSVLGRDLWRATVADGINIPTGRVFKFRELMNGASVSANDLTAVAGAPANTNELKAGYYMANEICGVLSAWLAGEKAAGRISGFYNFSSPVSSNNGLRTRCNWRRENASAATAFWRLEMPGEVACFLGVTGGEPGALNQSETWTPNYIGGTSIDHIAEGEKAPFHTLIFKPDGPGSLGQEFSAAISYEAENEAGEFVDNYAYLPQSIKGSCDSSKQWGLFLFDESVIVFGSLANGVLDNCAFAPIQLTGATDATANTYIGRRVDEPERGPVTLRQILMFEDRWKSIVKLLLYSSGTSGYNSSTNDTLSFQMSVGIPGELLGDEFDRSLDNMPGADLPIVVVIDEPTRLTDLLSGDMLLRRSFLRWKDQHFEFVQWRTPHATLSVAALTEATKASADPDPQFRCSSVINNELARPAIKFDYSRDYAIGRNDLYQRSFGVEDQTQVDDLGGNVSIQTIKLRNTFAGTASVGAGLDSLLQDFVAVMPTFRPSLSVERSLDQRYFLELAPGDIVTVTDSFARDPITGTRGITARAGMVISVSYQLGGFSASGGKEPQLGRIEINFLDVQRNETYAPAAYVDYTAGSGGFSAGYNSGTVTLRCFEHSYSSNGVVITARGRRRTIEEDDDATHFDAGDKILIVEMDPTDPANPTYWEREISSQSGQDIVLTSALSSPAWDAAKRYRIVPQKWSQVAASQQDWSYQADDADHTIEDNEVPFHFSASEEQDSFTTNSSTIQGEYLPNMSYGDGRPYDVGHERGLIDTISAFQDRKSAHQGSFLWNRTARANAITWNTLYCGPIFLGMDLLYRTITRTLTVAPFWRSATGAASSLRVTLSRIPPQAGAATDPLAYGADAFRNPKFHDAYSQTASWSTTSTTWATDSDKTLSVGVKDMTTGIAWLVVEGSGEAECRGLSKMIEGIRTVG